MDDRLFFQILTLLIVLLIGAYSILSLFLNSGSNEHRTIKLPSLFFFGKDKKETDGKTDKRNALESKEEKKNKRESAPMRDYSEEANQVAEKEKRILEYINEENKKLEREAPPMPHVPYEDDQSSIALDELFSLRRAIRSVTRELTSLRKSNKEMQEMIKQLHIDHGDALGRIEGTNLMAQERELWESKFAREFRKYEEAMKHNPHILTPNVY